jgi:single-strand DNA-binding protein
VNSCNFVGRLTADPELRSTNSGKAVVEFSIAVNEGKDANGGDRVTYVNCQAWEGAADQIAKFFVKGKPIFVQASLRNEKWETPEGEKRRSERFVVNRWGFVPTDNTQRSNGEAAPEGAEAAPATPKRGRPRRNAQAAPEAAEVGVAADSGDEDIPF